MTDNIKKYKRLTVIISIVLPIAVALLFSVKIEGVDLTFLPSIYATINGLTAIVLIAAYIAIKKKKKKRGRKSKYNQKAIIMAGLKMMTLYFLLLYLKKLIYLITKFILFPILAGIVIRVI